MLFSHVVYGALGCPEVGLNNILAPLSIKVTPAEIFRLPIGVGWLLAPFSRWGLLAPLFRGGGLLALFGSFVVGPFCSGYAFFTMKNASLLNYFLALM